MPWPPKPDSEPDARRQFADLRHAVQRVAEHAAPHVLELDRPQLRIDLRDVGLQRACKTSRIALPGGRPARPHQPVAADDAVVVVGQVGVADGALERHRLSQPLAERLGRHHIGPDRHAACAATLGISAPRWTLPASTTWSARSRPGGRDDPLAHAGGVDRQRRRLLEDARTRRFRGGRKPERVVERMDMECLRREHRVEIVVALEHLAHALDRPAFDLPAEVLADQADGGEVVVGVVRSSRP